MGDPSGKKIQRGAKTHRQGAPEIVGPDLVIRGYFPQMTQVFFEIGAFDTTKNACHKFIGSWQNGTVFHRLEGAFQEHAMGRVHDLRLEGGNAEERGIEIVDVLQLWHGGNKI